MKRTIPAWTALWACLAIGCSGAPGSPLSPSGAPLVDWAANPDGSTLKVTAPSGLSPNGTILDTRRPTLSFTNASGVYVPVGLAYEIVVEDGTGTAVYGRTIGETPGTSAHTLDTDLDYAQDWWWRARARLENEVGPWSGYAQFRTPDPPPPPPPPPTPGGGLPFPVPAACGPGAPDDRSACVAAVAALSAEWQGCRGGSGVRCHRFTRQVVFALAQSDPNWQMIQAALGGNACNCSFCGPSDGTMFREDTAVYGGNRVFDMILGAGGPTPSLAWQAVPGPRAGDLPATAPLCP